MPRAVVVGSGPNGLSAALKLASEGFDVEVLEAAQTIGGGTRSGHATIDGLIHDECSGFHPLAVDNAFTREFDLASHGLTWALPEIQYSHPLDGGLGASVWADLNRTVFELGPAGESYARIFTPLVKNFGRVSQEFLQPMVHVPRAPFALARFGGLGAMPATMLSGLLNSPEAKALFGGVAAHAFRPLNSVLSSAIGLALGTAAHVYGWPVAVGGSSSIANAIADRLRLEGGKIHVGVRVTSLSELGSPDVIMLDTSPRAAASILGSALPTRVARAYESFRHGPGAFQLALAVEGGLPWRFEDARRSGTVHLGGTMEEMAHSERETWRGRMPDRPFVLVGQQSIADPTRRQDEIHPIDLYAHVPSGYAGDATEAILNQVERFAPGARERIVGMSVRSTEAIVRDNPNYVGGDIVSGANTPKQLVFRPRVTLDPYSTGIQGVYLCSAATAPGAGAHGMCGWNAARVAIRHAEERRSFKR